MVTLTGVIACGGIISALIFGLQLNAMRGQKETMDAQQKSMQGQLNEMIDERRPWIEVQAAINGPIWFRGGEAHINILWTLKNSGHLPANKLDVMAEPFAGYTANGGIAGGVSDATEPTEEGKRWCAMWGRYPNQGSGPTIFPSGEFRSFDGYSVPKTFIDKAAAGSTNGDAVLLFLAGCVTYSYSGSDAMHHTPFVYMISAIDENLYIHRRININVDTPPSALKMTQEFPPKIPAD